MNTIEYQIYDNWFNSLIDLAPLHKMIHLKTDPRISFDRIIKKNRIGENNIPFKYIKSCNKYHDDMFDLMNIDKKIIDCSIDFNDDSYFENISKQIIDFIK